MLTHGCMLPQWYVCLYASCYTRFRWLHTRWQYRCTLPCLSYTIEQSLYMFTEYISIVLADSNIMILISEYILVCMNMTIWIGKPKCVGMHVHSICIDTCEYTGLDRTYMCIWVSMRTYIHICVYMYAHIIARVHVRVYLQVYEYYLLPNVE